MKLGNWKVNFIEQQLYCFNEDSYLSVYVAWSPVRDICNSTQRWAVLYSFTKIDGDTVRMNQVTGI